jgi:hypothetical protein
MSTHKNRYCLVVNHSTAIFGLAEDLTIDATAEVKFPSNPRSASHPTPKLRQIALNLSQSQAYAAQRTADARREGAGPEAHDYCNSAST